MIVLKPGDIAPDFSGPDQDEKLVQLKDFKGKKLVLFFYPKDNTPGCTAEACNLRDNYADLTKNGYEVIGISPDSVKSHKNFSSRQNLPYHILADTEKKILSTYGVWGEKKMYGKSYMGVNRTTFIIDENGRIAEIITKQNTKDHAEQILNNK